jgi:hypothetical protein
MSDARLFEAAAPRVEVIYVREPHEVRAREVAVVARGYAVVGARASARGAAIAGHCVRGFLAGLFKG